MKKSPCIIAISGDPVAGKSTAISAIMSKYEDEGYTISENPNGKCVIKLAAGRLFRDIAEQGGMELQVLNNFASKPDNSMRDLRKLSKNPEFFASFSDEMLSKSVDDFIDSYMLSSIDAIEKKYTGIADVIILVDSRIAGLLMKQKGKECMNVRFAVQPEIAAVRLVKDAKNRRGEISVDDVTEQEAFDEALKSVTLRRDKERERFIKNYSNNIFDEIESSKVDIQNLDNYDLVIDTSGTTSGNVKEVMFGCIEKYRTGNNFEKNWRSTKFIYPGHVFNQIVDSNEVQKLFVVKIDEQYFAIKGQEYVGNGNKVGFEAEGKTNDESGYPILPIEIIDEKSDIFLTVDKNNEFNLTYAELIKYLKNNITAEFVESFERDYGFKYPEIGVTKLKAEIEIDNVATNSLNWERFGDR